LQDEGAEARFSEISIAQTSTPSLFFFAW